ncbi:Enoyl-(Acyl carrier protein) reductase [Teratosphaeria destructans]|uniref:Enoyl-(Acyl carrier protein) reductase n=1 Tax=Teratosphaeria destructans TaxID=418781 RepID=A0A9W7SXR5_9PEZI|nr:Enoyl-(Acyl carrier protein) reductase [Teratosphaeria destructans]
MPPTTAYITGAASGIGKAVAEMLVQRGIRVALADLSFEGVQNVASSLNANGQSKVGGAIAPESDQDVAMPFCLDAADWQSQREAFEKALDAMGGRIDLVYPIAGIGEKLFLQNDGGKGTGFVKPDLSVLDVDLYGFIYTASLAIQQMRRQQKDEEVLRGRIAVVASVCGFYCVPTLPIYTAAKHAVIGFVRSYGKYLPEESITLNAVCPNAVRTNISTSGFYDAMEEKGFLTPMDSVMDAFEKFLDDAQISGECWEAGPRGDLVRREPAEHLDAESAEVMRLLYHRGHALHEPAKG